jgi:hypothetical protein
MSSNSAQTGAKTRFARPSRSILPWLLALVAIGGIIASTTAQEKKAKRAKHKSFAKTDVFFADVFSNFVGGRPDFSETATMLANGADGADATSGPAAGGFEWSTLITAETIENEIKALKLSVDKDVTTPSEFKGRGYLEVRRHFSLVAALMAVIHDYDSDVRWQEPSAGLRDLFARSAANAKVGTQQTYNESKLRKLDMQDVIGGGAVPVEAKDPENHWEAIVDRPPLMERLKVAFEEKLLPSVANEGEFKKSLKEMKHEAEMLAMIAEILTRDGMEDAGDETYDEFAKSMQQGAKDYLEAIKLEDYAMARGGAGLMGKACSNCHGDYQ